MVSSVTLSFLEAIKLKEKKKKKKKKKKEKRRRANPFKMKKRNYQDDFSYFCKTVKEKRDIDNLYRFTRMDNLKLRHE